MVQPSYFVTSDSITMATKHILEFINQVDLKTMSVISFNDILVYVYFWFSWIISVNSAFNFIQCFSGYFFDFSQATIFYMIANVIYYPQCD